MYLFMFSFCYCFSLSMRVPLRRKYHHLDIVITVISPGHRWPAAFSAGGNWIVPTIGYFVVKNSYHPLTLAS